MRSILSTCLNGLRDNLNEFFSTHWGSCLPVTVTDCYGFPNFSLRLNGKVSVFLTFSYAV